MLLRGDTFTVFMLLLNISDSRVCAVAFEVIAQKKSVNIERSRFTIR